MPRNIEIKARVDDVDALLPHARTLADGPEQLIEQDDCFFALAPGRGRLKLRRFADGSAELIHYHRDDRPEARASDYRRAPLADGEALLRTLEPALGAAGRVRKRRWLLLRGRTRIHLDRVDGLGDFVEIEVVLEPAQSDADGVRIAEAILDALGLRDAPRIACAYVDLL